MATLAELGLPATRRTLNEEVMNRVIRHQAYLQQLGTGEVVKINKLIEDLEGDIFGQLSRRFDKIVGKGFDRGPRTTKRLQELNHVMGKLNATAMRDMRLGLREQLINVAQDEIDFVKDTFDKASPVKLDTQLPSPALLRAIATTDPINGTPLTKWFDKLGRGTQERLERAIQLGMAEGQTLGQIVQRIRGTRANKFMDGALGATRRQAEAIARTGLNHVSTATRTATYQANKDLIKGVKWVSTLDARTCPQCAGLDGTVFKLDTSHTNPPAHVGCRCTLTPVLKSYKEMGIPLKGAPAGTRASMNGQVPGDVTYGKWLKDQPKGVQKRVLGKKKSEAFRSGKLKIDQFTNDHGKTLTLKDLGLAEGRKPSLKPKAKPVAKKVAVAKKTPPVSPLKQLEEIERETVRRQDIVGDQFAEIEDRIEAYDEGELIRKQVAALNDRFPSARAVKRTQKALADTNKEYVTLLNKHGETHVDVVKKRKEVDELTAALKKRGQAAGGLSPSELKKKIREESIDILRVEKGENPIEYRGEQGSFFGSNANLRKGERNRLEAHKFYGDVLAPEAELGGIRSRINYTTFYEPYRDRAAYQHSRGGVMVSAKDSTPTHTYVHELGHALEHLKIDEGNTVARQFVKYRTAGETPVQLNKVLPTFKYKPNEYGMKDDFAKMFEVSDKNDLLNHAYYTGKTYKDGTEIISMLMETLWDNPAALAENDPEAFKFIIGYLRGAF